METLTATVPDLRGNHANAVDGERRALMQRLVSVYARVKDRQEGGATVVESTAPLNQRSALRRRIVGNTYILKSSRASASEMTFFVTTKRRSLRTCTGSIGPHRSRSPSGNVIARGAEWYTFLLLDGRDCLGSGEDVRARLGASLSPPFSYSDAARQIGKGPLGANVMGARDHAP